MKKTSKKKQSAKGTPETSAQSGLTEPLKEEFLNFLDFHSAKRLSINLRKLLTDFLLYDGSTEAIYLRDLVYDLSGLFELLDVAEREWKGTE